MCGHELLIVFQVQYAIDSVKSKRLPSINSTMVYTQNS